MLGKSSLRFRVITQETDLQNYSLLTKKYIDVQYPQEYLARSRVIALVSEDFHGNVEHIFGGYILALSHPFRVLEQIPPGIIENHPHLQKCWHECLELTGLWIHPLIKDGKIRFRFWWKLFMELTALSFKGKPYILYSYDASCKKLGDMYSVSKPSRIFEGEVYLPGMTAENREIVEMGSTRAVLKAFFAHPFTILRFVGKRLFRNRFRTSRQHQHQQASA